MSSYPYPIMNTAEEIAALFSHLDHDRQVDLIEITIEQLLVHIPVEDRAEHYLQTVNLLDVRTLTGVHNASEQQVTASSLSEAFEEMDADEQEQELRSAVNMRVHDLYYYGAYGPLSVFHHILPMLTDGRRAEIREHARFMYADHFSGSPN